MDIKTRLQQAYIGACAPKVGKRIGAVAFLIFLVSLSSPALAQVDATDNVITRSVWWLANMAYYGAGGVIVLFGILIPIGKKILGHRVETNPVVNILWALAYFSAPLLLQLGIDHFSGDVDGGAMLDDMEVGLGID